MELVPISKVKANPANPRTIKDDKFARLVESLKNFPEMANVRPIIVNTDMVALGGNMRLKAMKQAGWKQAPVEIVDWPEEKQREFIIKDNIGYGEWDWQLIAAEWPEAAEWDLEVPVFEPIQAEAVEDDLSDSIKSLYRIEVICKDENEQETTYNKFIEQGYECRLLTL
jgi:hypothetical protein